MAIAGINLSPNLIGTQLSQFQAGMGARNPVSASRSAGEGVVAQFSAFGQFQASLADLQSKAQALKNSSKPPTFQDFQVVVQGFVQSLNSLRENASRLRQAEDGVRKAVDGGDKDTLAALQETGVSQRADGLFSVNDQQLEKRFRDDRSGALSGMLGAAERFVRTADKQDAPRQPPPIRGGNAGGHAASKAIASYAAVAAL